MKPEPDFLKQVLTTLQASSSPWPSVGELEQAGIEPDGKLCFHLELLNDHGFIESKSEDGSFGFHEDIGGEVCWRDVLMRITATGHEFIEAMEQPEVWSAIKTEFKDASIKTIFSVGRALVEGFAKKKLGRYLEGIEI